MSSGDLSGLDRILKLWISLWNLVLENKRHYESVCAVLQRLVFEKTAWPKYKNWPVICELGRTEPLMQKIIQDLDITVVNERNARIMAAFSDCFSQNWVSGLPLSIIQKRIVESGMTEFGVDNVEGELENVKSGNNLWIFWDDLCDELGFPLIFLFDPDAGFSQEDLEEYDEDIPSFICPEGVSSSSVSAWSLIKFQGKSHVVVEIDGDEKRIAIVPAEYIALDL